MYLYSNFGYSDALYRAWARLESGLLCYTWDFGALYNGVSHTQGATMDISVAGMLSISFDLPDTPLPDNYCSIVVFVHSAAGDRKRYSGLAGLAIRESPLQFLRETNVEPIGVSGWCGRA